MNRPADLPASGVPMIDFPQLAFDLGEDTDMLRASVRAFAGAEIAPRAAEIDRGNGDARLLAGEAADLHRHP